MQLQYTLMNLYQLEQAKGPYAVLQLPTEIGKQCQQRNDGKEF